MESLENQCYSNMQTMIKTVEGLGIEYDENVVCDVCRSVGGFLQSFYMVKRCVGNPDGPLCQRKLIRTGRQVSCHVIKSLFYLFSDLAMHSFMKWSLYDPGLSRHVYLRITKQGPFLLCDPVKHLLSV